MNEASRRIRELRKKKGLNQSQLGAACGVDQSSISDIESKGAKFSADLLMRLCDALDAAPEFVMRGRASAWPFSRIPLERILALTKEDRAFIEGKLEAALDSVAEPPPAKPSTFIALPGPSRKSYRKAG